MHDISYMLGVSGMVSFQMNSYLSRLRAQMNPPMSQTALGEALGYAESYRQKKISLVESGKARLSPEEEVKVAEIFGVPVDDVRAILRPSETSAELTSDFNLFERVANSAATHLLAVCYSGRPRITSELPVLEKIASALDRGLCLAICIPYPFSVGDESTKSSDLLLNGYYTRVWGSAVARRDRILSLTSSDQAGDRLKYTGCRPAVSGAYASFLFSVWPTG